MSEFEDYFSEYENKHNCSPEKRECFEAGQQSQQAKIDLLEKELTETQAFLNKQNHIKQTKLDELQARIDDFIQYLKDNHFEIPEKTIEYFEDILKGDKDEN